jgi:hypothetical protein
MAKTLPRLHPDGVREHAKCSPGPIRRLCSGQSSAGCATIRPAVELAEGGHAVPCHLYPVLTRGFKQRLCPRQPTALRPELRIRSPHPAALLYTMSGGLTQRPNSMLCRSRNMLGVLDRTRTRGDGGV